MHRLRQAGEESRAGGLHHRQPHAVGGGILWSEHAGLVFVVQVVVLDEAEVPCGRIFHHPLEELQAVVEGEAHKADFALHLQPLHLLDELVRPPTAPTSAARSPLLMKSRLSIGI